MAGKDYYDILGVPRNATEEAIKKAYRALARKYHPDLHPDRKKEMEARFKEINEAYSVLSDPGKRSDYDLTGSAAFEPGMGGQYPPPDFGFDNFGFGGGFEDIFSDIFGTRGRRKGTQRGADIEYSLSLDFLRAVKGTEVKIKVTRRRGAVETVMVKIPPGIHDGARVRAASKGDEGYEGGPPGDMFIIIKVAGHRYFKRAGNDIYLDCPVTIQEALMGAEIKVPTIDGVTTIKIPPGIKGAQQLRIKGKGVYLPDGSRGDQYVTVNIAVPKRIDQRSKELLEEFSKINPYEPREGLW